MVQGAPLMAGLTLDAALAWAAQRKNGVLITIRGDGRAQSSDIVYLVDGDSFLISLTDGRAKTRNMRRDARVVLHITDPMSWSYLSFDATAALTAVAARPDDDVVDQLVAYYERVAGEAHPDWAEYRSAMVNDGRLLARVTPTSVTGQIR